jgi:transposase, IS5 family
LSFKRFLGLKASDKVPDSKSIWKFRETLIQEEVIEALFYRFNQALDDQSIFANTGQIVDASFVDVPRQRNTREVDLCSRKLKISQFRKLAITQAAASNYVISK